MMAAALIAAVLAGLSGSPGADLEVIDRGMSGARPLSPGDSVSWSIGVTATAIEVGALRIEVLGDGPRSLEDVLTVSLQGCAERWQPAGCSTGSFAISPPVSVTAWRGRWAPVIPPDGRIPQDVEVLAVVTLDEGADTVVQGERTALRIGFSASGLVCDSAPPGCSVAMEPVRTDLPRTGVDLAVSLLCGIGAVLLGVGIARWGSKRRVAAGRDLRR